MEEFKKTIINYQENKLSKIANKLKTRLEIKETVESVRQKNPDIKIVTTNGAFDMLHIGHINSLVKARSFGDILIVGLNSDASVRRYKSPLRPIIAQQYRAEMLAALEVVDYVTIFDEDDPRELLKVIKPDFHVKSRTGFKGIEREAVESNGGQIILLEDIPGISTTDIIKKILEIEKQEHKQ